MRIERAPDGTRAVFAAETMTEAAALGHVPAWAAQSKTWSPSNLPLLVVDPGQPGAVMTAWSGGNGMTPVALIAAPLMGISRAVGMQSIFNAFGYARYQRPFGHDSVFNNPAYIAGHAVRSFADVDVHVDRFAAALGIAVLDQTAGTIWDHHAPIYPAALLANQQLRIVHLVRDPRDLIVSAYFFYKRQTENAVVTGTADHVAASLVPADFTPARKDDALMDLIARGYYSVSPTAFARVDPPQVMLKRMLATLADPRVFTLRYERQHRDPVAQYGALVDWLAAANGGRTIADKDAVIADAVHRGTFAAQTGGKVSEGKHDEAPRDISPTGHVRKGIVGDWRNHFSPAVRKAFHDSVGDLLIAAGFEADPDWWRA